MTSTGRDEAHPDDFPWPPTRRWVEPLAGRIECLMTDVDGVLTDGSLTYDSAGVETKTFHARDGLAMKRWTSLGLPLVIVTARQSEMVGRRGQELGVTRVLQGFEAKWPAVQEVLRDLQVDASRCAYVGDDIPDVPVLKRVGLAAVPADASFDARRASTGTLMTAGGRGVLRELIEVLLRLRGQWHDAESDR